MEKLYKNICRRKGCGHPNLGFNKKRKGENCGGCGLPLLISKKKKSILDRKVLIIKLKSYQGNDTALEITPNPLFMVVDAKTGEEWDNGYRSYEEAKTVFPNAIN